LIDRISKIQSDKEDLEKKLSAINAELQMISFNDHTNIHELLSIMSKNDNQELRLKVKTELARIIEKIEVKETKMINQHQVSSKLPIIIKIHYRHGGKHFIYRIKDLGVMSIPYTLDEDLMGMQVPPVGSHQIGGTVGDLIEAMERQLRS
jgi:hypothetical protein